MLLTAPLTHSDWYLHPQGPAWGPDGVRTMLEHCRECGLRRIYWRVFDSGRALYASRLLEPFRTADHQEPWQYSPGWIPPPADPDVRERLLRLDYSEFDTLAAAVAIGHELDLEIYAWLTINEDDHGFGFPSAFARKNPAFRWIRRNHKPYQSQLSFAFAEVRSYKLDLVREILAYPVDGLLLDWLRTGDIRDNPQTDDQGVADFGYEQPNIRVMQKRFGIHPADLPNNDPRWVQVRAEPITQFMRDLRQLSQPLPILVLIAHPWAYRGLTPDQQQNETRDWVRRMGGNRIAGSLNGLLCDIGTWSDENLATAYVPAGYYLSPGTPAKACASVQAEIGAAGTVMPYFWLPASEAEVSAVHDAAQKLQCREVLFWEADYIDQRPEPLRSAICAQMRALRACP